MGIDQDEVQKLAQGSCDAMWAVQATNIALTDAKGTLYHYSNVGHRITLRAQRQDLPASNNREKGVIYFTGKNLHENALKELILSTCPKKFDESDGLKSVTSITMEEKRRIQKEHLMDPLPDGVFFDGIQYIDVGGVRSNFHPNIDKFIDEYVQKNNTKSKKQDEAILRDRTIFSQTIRRLDQS